MSGETDEPTAAAERLEAALERIARAAARDAPARPEMHATASTDELAVRLDALIHRLRTALGGTAG